MRVVAAHKDVNLSQLSGEWLGLYIVSLKSGGSWSGRRPGPYVLGDRIEVAAVFAPEIEPHLSPAVVEEVICAFLQQLLMPRPAGVEAGGALRGRLRVQVHIVRVEGAHDGVDDDLPQGKKWGTRLRGFGYPQRGTVDMGDDDLGRDRHECRVDVAGKALRGVAPAPSEAPDDRPVLSGHHEMPRCEAGVGKRDEQRAGAEAMEERRHVDVRDVHALEPHVHRRDVGGHSGNRVLPTRRPPARHTASAELHVLQAAELAHVRRRKHDGMVFGNYRQRRCGDGRVVVRVAPERDVQRPERLRGLNRAAELGSHTAREAFRLLVGRRAGRRWAPPRCL